MNTCLGNQIYYVGVNDKEIDLFEGQYIVPNGISYNSYVIVDNKTAVMDTVDVHKANEWLSHLKQVLGHKKPDYLVVSHMEPDHAGSIDLFLKQYPSVQIVTNQKAIQMLGQFFPHLDLTNKIITVTQGDTLSLGEHKLMFILAPMVHWPEVMVTYEETEKILFSADGFGKFGALDTEEEWDCEARRYYINIVGKYGQAVQTLLKKASALDIQKIFPLHGPMLTDNLAYYLHKYDIWSSYQPEDKGIFIAYTSIYGNTQKAVFKLRDLLLEKGETTVVVSDLARSDMAECVEDAFRYNRLVLACPTYDGGLFPYMSQFIARLKSKNFQNRTVGFIENGSWAPLAGQLMVKEMSALKNMRLIEHVVTIQSALKEQDIVSLSKLADDLLFYNR
ncbi:MAG: FprA family A-type flavoprotein [Alphaproteobacteria bacterium]|nr:FprA family A-type flavoprotein [Alphaproteobacteria bacterium]